LGFVCLGVVGAVVCLGVVGAVACLGVVGFVLWPTLHLQSPS